MTWTQPICDWCWEHLEPDRDPVRIKEAYRDEEICAHCGFQTRSGIYRGHRLHLVSLDVLRLFIEAGFELADQFIVVGGTSLSSTVWARQERARRNHSVLWVGIKP